MKRRLLGGALCLPPAVALTVAAAVAGGHLDARTGSVVVLLCFAAVAATLAGTALYRVIRDDVRKGRGR